MRKSITGSILIIYHMYHVYEYEATKTCPVCGEEKTVPAAACVDEGTGRELVLALKVKCERHLPEMVSRCELSGPIGPVTEIRMTDQDAFGFMAQKMRDGFCISSRVE